MFRCARGHSYDVARSGYINLLQPQDRRSLAAGDRRDVIESRARLLAAGIGRAIVDAVVARSRDALAPDSVVADLGSGSGEVVAALSEAPGVVAIGIDLSTAAADHAARRFPGAWWVVANADRRLPLLDRSVDRVLSLHGRRAPAECARVLSRGGQLLIAVPAADDLVELRALVQGRGTVRERADAVVAEHRPHFTVADRFTLREQHRLGRDELRDLLRGTYRGERRASLQKLAAVDALDVTLASDVMVFKIANSLEA